MLEVNDRQSQLNRTLVAQIARPKSVDEIGALIIEAKASGRAVSIAGGRHAMGGQQFGQGTLLLDMSAFNRVIAFDRSNGLIEVESGIMWPQLIDYLHAEQKDSVETWAIRQKQTGVDEVTIGGSLSANIHGRGLNYAPFVDDIESFEILDAEGETRRCSRSENRELFSLAIGGYGLFGVVTRVALRLEARKKLKRLVEVIAVRNLLTRIDHVKSEGFLYGDCQYSIDLESDEEFHSSLFSCYKAVPDNTPIAQKQKVLSAEDWSALYSLSRSNKRLAWERFTQYYLSTSGQVYWSDTHQLSNVFQGYSGAIDSRLGTEMITEVYLCREAFIPFMIAARRDFVENKVDMTYGTIRFIEKDTTSFLAWATEPWVCVVCNLHVVHTPVGLEKAAEDFRRIIDRVIQFGGRFFLTYHKWATREQIETCYPEFEQFLKLKLRYDPQERFQSNWYRHWRKLFS